MINWTIRRRLFIVALLPALLVGVVLYFFFLSSQLELIERNLLQQGQATARLLAMSSSFGVLTANEELLKQQAEYLLGQDQLIGIALKAKMDDRWLLQLKSLGQSRSSELDGCRQRFTQQAPPPGGTLIFCAPISYPGMAVNDYPGSEDGEQTDPLGWVYVEVSNDDYLMRREIALEQASKLGLMVFLITLAIAYRVADQIARPLTRLAELVGTLSEVDLSRRSEESQPGEIGTLQRGVNRMLETLQLNQQQLESRIREQTSDLRHANLQLEERNRDLNEQRELAQHASQAKSQFLAIMSHEIRTPISGILGMLELLGKTPLDRKQQLFFSNLSLEARALKALIDDILDFSRIEAGKMPVDLCPFSPEELYGEVVSMLAPNAHNKGLEIGLMIDSATPRLLEGDPQKLRQVLINLIANAIKFTSSGEVQIELQIQHSDNGTAMVHTQVRDTGPGIAHQQQEQIFEGFTQADSSTTRLHGGSGLGTSIAKRMVELLGGRIGLQSEPGQGSCFWFEFPCVELQPCEEGDEPLRGQVALLESNPHSGRAGLSLLNRLGWQATLYPSPEALLNGVESQPPEWILFAESSREHHCAAIAKRLRQQLAKGDVTFCHLIHFGSTIDDELFDYTLYKPLYLEPLQDLLGQQKRPQLPSPAEDGPKSEKQILIAEDSFINALALRSFCEMAGHRVEVVEDGEQALERLQEGGIDLIFMDMRMPHLDGLEATRLWRAQEGSRLPIIAITANATLEDRRLCLDAGMDDFISKPVTAAQVAELIERWCGGQACNTSPPAPYPG